MRKNLSFEEQLALIYPQKITLTENEYDILSNEAKLHRDDDTNPYIIYTHHLSPVYLDVVKKAKSFAGIVRYNNTLENTLVWFYDLYQAQQAQKQI